MKEVRVDDAPSSIGPYSQAVVHGDLVFCSGQLGLDPVKGVLVEGAVEQARQALVNLEAVLRGAESSLHKGLRVTLYLTDLSVFPRINEVYAEFFVPPFPARTAVQVSALPKGALVEIDIIARR
ncbi:MAG TPA: Rid family detoxifying hydrolase [Methanomassiliicoccales archaeon]|nr:Rid family detoxifying hydrolase [Methanomassiliicoccales archaeon]HSA35886.1 Rid family detoxifying hydrolase [Methanomassiliicoccales archaeon]